jgi:hypothetical protein
MTIVALGMNGQAWIEVPDVEELKSSLHRMDGKKLYSLVMWRLPANESFEKSNPNRNAEEYLQCAGSADRVAVELRKREGTGFAQYAIGQVRGKLPSPDLSERISWAAYTVEVAQHEVFNADTAYPLFREYFLAGRLPDDVTLRGLDED